MSHLIRILYEGAAQAWGQLISNKLRSFLSLLGVTIGIFCIVGVTTAVDSLSANIRNSLEKLGNNVIYIEKFSWGEDPGANYWKWMRRPNFTYDDFLALKERLSLADKVGFWQFLGAQTAKWQSSSVEETYFLAITEDCNDLFHLEFADDGRFFSNIEYQSGADVCVIGHEIAQGLFGANVDPLDREISVAGRRLRVIGVLKASGKDLLKPFNFDQCVLVGYNLARRGFNIRSKAEFERTSVSVRAADGVNIDDMKDEITGVLRAQRRLAPREENNFALNTLSVLSNLFDILFGTMNVAGYIIGGFSLLVGMFSVANIMFVSVRERTSQIGIKMALGAKRWFILLEVLVEAVGLCLAGGALGLILIWLGAKAASQASDFEIFLSVGNMVFGVVISVVVGVLSGLIPAAQASRMDPVEAIRK